MDNSDNGTSEKSSHFNDGMCDPEVEARLYSEIYYSNETWVQNSDAENHRDKELTDAEKEVSAVSSTAVSDIDNNVSKEVPQQNHPQTRPNSVHSNCRADIVSGHNLKSKFNQSRYQFADRLSKESRIYNHRSFERGPKDRENFKCTSTKDRGSRLTGKSTNFSSAKASCARAETDAAKQCVNAQEVVEPTNNYSFHSTPKAGLTDRAECNVGRRILDDRDESRKTQNKSVNKKLNMKGALDTEVVEILSDSDESILEVPIPPRAQPPVIQLVDSDDECAKRIRRSLISTNDGNKEKRSCDKLSARFNGQNVSNSAEISSVSSTDLPNLHETNDTTILLNTVNPMSNCSNVRASASSREAIGIIGEAAATVCGTSEDSMTESEATNWNNIAAKQANDTRIRDILPIEESLLEPLGLSCDQSNFDRAAQSDHDKARPICPSDSSGKTINVVRNAINFSVRNYGEEINQRTNRKRRKDLDSNLSEKSNALEVPKKRNKKNSCKTDSDKSLTEYFFKGMPKKLQTFYNDPWGTENLDLHRVQSAMPKHPRHWEILDADLSPVSKRRGKICTRCGTNSHRGKRCLERAAEPCCVMCGAKGHLQTRCPQTMCLTCGHKYMTFRQTCGYCSKLYCNMCNGTGHTHEECPDLWRRYHDTTSEIVPAPRDPKNIMKAAQDLSCCNCAKRGHDATMCKQLRWSQHFPTPMYVTSYTDGPIYPPLYREPSFQDENNSGYIECVGIPDDNVTDVNNTLLVDTINSGVKSNVVFQCGNVDFPNGIDHHRLSKRFDKHDAIHTHGLLAGTVKPDFLNLWLKNFVFNVRITCDRDESIILVIEANCKKLIHGLKKLLLQWLTRRDDEKTYLTYDAFPYGSLTDITEELGRKVRQMKTVLEPTVILKKVVAIEETLRHTCAKLQQIESEIGVPKEARKRTRAIKIQLRNIMKNQNQLIASLYAGSWIPGSDVIVRSFRRIANQLKYSRKNICIEDYMKIVYLNNEIFTFRMTDSIAEALRRATSMLNEKSNLVPPIEQSGDLLHPNNLIALDNMMERSDLFDQKNNTVNNCGQSTASQNDSPNNILDDCLSQYAQILESFGYTERFTAIKKSDKTIIMNNIESNESDHEPQNSQNLLINHNTKATISKGRKNVDEELIANLSKKKRKAYRRSARKAIKLANLSNRQSLQKMAKELKSKIYDCSFRKDDLQLLQNALIGEKNTLKRILMKNRNSLFKADKK